MVSRPCSTYNNVFIIQNSRLGACLSYLVGVHRSTRRISYGGVFWPMTQNQQQELGTVLSLWRYPVKSMMGEALSQAYVQDQGVLGDRAYALLDCETGKAASAKNPGKWPALFGFHATFLERLRGSKMPPVEIMLPDGATVTSEQPEVDEILSTALNRQDRPCHGGQGEGRRRAIAHAGRMDGEGRRVLAGNRRARPHRRGHRFHAAGGDVFRRCDDASRDDRHARPSQGIVSPRTLRSATFSS